MPDLTERYAVQRKLLKLRRDLRRRGVDDAYALLGAMLDPRWPKVLRYEQVMPDGTVINMAVPIEPAGGAEPDPPPDDDRTIRLLSPYDYDAGMWLATVIGPRGVESARFVYRNEAS